MSKFDDRENAFEAKYKMDQEREFKVNARRCKLVGLWAADLMGITGEEAAAYAKFAGKSLPSVHHWRRAYGTGFSLPYVLPRSNFAGDGPALVGEYAGMGPFGTFDMAGNAREWGFLLFAALTPRAPKTRPGHRNTRAPGAAAAPRTPRD